MMSLGSFASSDTAIYFLGLEALVQKLKGRKQQIERCNKSIHFGMSIIGNELAVQAWNCWQEIPQHFPFVEPNAFVVMPDHVHSILFINRPADYAERPETHFGPQSNHLASIIRGFKVGVKAWATRQGINCNWQPRYYDRIIRNELELEKIRDYIQGNPNRWEAEQQHELSIFR